MHLKIDLKLAGVRLLSVFKQVRIHDNSCSPSCLCPPKKESRNDGRTNGHPHIDLWLTTENFVSEKPDRCTDRWTDQPPYNQVNLDKDMPERHVVHPYLPLSAHFLQDKTQNALAIKMALSHY